MHACARTHTHTHTHSIYSSASLWTESAEGSLMSIINNFSLTHSFTNQGHWQGVAGRGTWVGCSHEASWGHGLWVEAGLPAVSAAITPVLLLGRFSCVWLFASPWAVAHQAPLSMECPRQEPWSGLPCPPPGNLPDPGIKPESLTSPALAGEFLTTSPTWEVQTLHLRCQLLLISSYTFNLLLLPKQGGFLLSVVFLCCVGFFLLFFSFKNFPFQNEK